MPKRDTKKPRSIGMTDALWDEIQKIAEAGDRSSASVVEEAMAEYLASPKSTPPTIRGHRYANAKALSKRFEGEIRNHLKSVGVPFDENIPVGPYFADFRIKLRTPLIIVLKSAPESIPIGIAELMAVRSMLNGEKLRYALVIPYHFGLSPDITKTLGREKFLLLTPAELSSEIARG